MAKRQKPAQANLAAAVPPALSGAPTDPWVLLANTQAKIDQIERLRSSTVIAYHLGEGAALADEQMIHLHGHLKRIGGQKRLDLWIHSRGGATEVPWKIIQLMREYCSERFAVLIPYRAHSAATHVALGADEIVMTPMSELGPVDPFRRHPLLPMDATKRPLAISVQDLKHFVSFIQEQSKGTLSSDASGALYAALFEHVHPLVIGAMEQSYTLAQLITKRALSTHMDPEADKAKIEELAKALSDDYKSHTYPIGRREASALGLPIANAPQDLEDVMWSLYETFDGLKIEGKTSKPGLGARGIGYLKSRSGSTLGMGIYKQGGDSDEYVGATWESRWT